MAHSARTMSSRNDTRLGRPCDDGDGGGDSKFEGMAHCEWGAAGLGRQNIRRAAVDQTYCGDDRELGCPEPKTTPKNQKKTDQSIQTKTNETTDYKAKNSISITEEKIHEHAAAPSNTPLPPPPKRGARQARH